MCEGPFKRFRPQICVLSPLLYILYEKIPEHDSVIGLLEGEDQGLDDFVVLSRRDCWLQEHRGLKSNSGQSVPGRGPGL